MMKERGRFKVNGHAFQYVLLLKEQISCPSEALRVHLLGSYFKLVTCHLHWAKSFPKYINRTSLPNVQMTSNQETEWKNSCFPLNVHYVRQSNVLTGFNFILLRCLLKNLSIQRTTFHALPAVPAATGNLYSFRQHVSRCSWLTEHQLH